MIEKFTKEELATIVEELKALPKDVQKRTLCKEEIRTLYAMFSRQHDYEGIYAMDAVDALFTLADFVLCNYAHLPKKTEVYRRNILVKHEFAEDYRKFIADIVALVPKYFRTEVLDD